MKINATDNFFTHAKPIWAKGLEKEKNITLGLYKNIRCESGSAILKIAASGFYRVFVNGKFTYFGPARCAHGYYRVDEIELNLKKGENHIAIETVNYYVNSFYSLMQSGFIEAELVSDGAAAAVTDEAGENAFELYELCERIRRVQRYSYQRPFAEAYRLTEDFCGWRTGVNGANVSPRSVIITDEKCLLPRNIPESTFTEVSPCSSVCGGSAVFGIKPEKYRKDRSLIYIKNPARGNLE